ncbi:MAG: PIN domain-containing protein [Terriglobales bacterium]
MGLILDSSVLIAGERRDQSIRQILDQLRAMHGETEAALSVVTVLELTRGIYRAKTEAHRARRRAFAEEVYRDMVVHPVSFEIAQLAGRIEAEQMAQGIGIAFQDLLIEATALHLGFDVATLNIRHFQKIPGLKIVSPLS